jgi:hypothetical protein
LTARRRPRRWYALIADAHAPIAPLVSQRIAGLTFIRPTNATQLQAPLSHVIARTVLDVS